MHIFSIFADHIQGIVSQGGYAVVFIGSTLEGIPIIGSVIPGHTIIILAGFLSRIGIFNIWPVIILSTLGAVLGDAIGYGLGMKYGYSFIEKIGKHFFIQKEHIDKAKNIIDKHTGKALILGRFNPVARALTPFLVGASGAHIKRFWLYDIIGAVAWSTSSVAIGYIFGASYHLISGYIGKFVVVAIILAALILWAYRFVNSRWHVFVRYDIFTLILNFLALYLLFKTMQDIVTIPSFMTELDIHINLFVAQHISSTLKILMKFITSLGSPMSISILAVIAIVSAAIRHRWQNILLIGLSFSGVLFWTAFLKDVVTRVRPENALVTLTDYSFPSLHAGMAAVACVLFVYLYAIHIHHLIKRELVIVAFFLVSIAVAFSRIYLNVHWFSDVVAGYALGLFWATLMILFVKYVSVLVIGRKS